MIRARLMQTTIGACGAALALAGCSFDGLNSIPLPGNSTKGDTYQVTVQMADVQNLVANSEVKSANVTIGTIRKVEVNGWSALLTVELQQGNGLPENTTAKLAQKSLLGAQYLELNAPDDQSPIGTLSDGDVVPLDRTSRYPETEEVLSTLSLLLNGGGLEQIRAITTQMNAAMGGREEQIHDLFGRLGTFVDGLDVQRDQIVRAIDSIDRLGVTLSEQTTTIDTGIASIQPAVNVLETQQTQLVTMLDKVGSAADIANNVLAAGRDDLKANLASLAPTLTELAASGSTLADSLVIAGTGPFPVTTAADTIRGDYINLYMTLDLSLPTLQNDVLGSIPDPGALTGMGTATGAVDPLRAPTEDRGNR
ncbi:MCE family protein [Rhodococcus sp. YH3-3]|uniref:MCE family protein n=1 Tax=Rhodococcus sp. YH3-3 TaxID=1803579 RepID=UPI000AA59A6B|nr:MCE family protein [Rhodococcus sp. YH3-3]